MTTSMQFSKRPRTRSTNCDLLESRQTVPRAIDRVFSVDQPVLAMNSLRTETERSEHKGFAALLKVFWSGAQPASSRAEHLWRGEDDAADYLSLISLLHRKLDHACQPRGREDSRCAWISILRRLQGLRASVAGASACSLDPRG